jgi:hypothetical protein
VFFHSQPLLLSEPSHPQIRAQRQGFPAPHNACEKRNLTLETA